MNQKEWLRAENSNRLRMFLDDQKASVRKLRLYAVACCRRLELSDPVCALALDLSERHADDKEVGWELYQAEEAVCDLQRNHQFVAVARDHALAAVLHAASSKESLTQLVAAESAIIAVAMSAAEAVEEARYNEVRNATELTEEQTHCRLIRDIFGNPFRPVDFNPVWRTDTAVAIAAQMYGSRNFSTMPILADALQDAGCDSEDILNHCRGPDPHVRGCWVVDLVLGKE